MRMRTKLMASLLVLFALTASVSGVSDSQIDSLEIDADVVLSIFTQAKYYDEEFATEDAHTILSLFTCYKYKDSIDTVGECRASDAWKASQSNVYGLARRAAGNDIGNMKPRLGESVETPAELDSSWTYVGKNEDICSSDGYQKGGGNSRWYYCKGDQAWRKYCSDGRAGEPGVCKGSEKFEIKYEDDNGKFRIVPASDYSIIDDGENIYKSYEGNYIGYEAAPGKKYEFQLSKDEDEWVTLVAPDFKLQSKPIASTGETFTVEIADYNGGTGEDGYRKIVSKKLSSGTSGLRKKSFSEESTDSSSPGIEKADFKSDSADLHYVKGSITDNTPGDGITTVVETPIWVGDGFTKDFEADPHPKDTASELKEDWEIYDDGSKRDESEWWSDDSSHGYHDLEHPWMEDEAVVLETGTSDYDKDLMVRRLLTSSNSRNVDTAVFKIHTSKQNGFKLKIFNNGQLKKTWDIDSEDSSSSHDKDYRYFKLSMTNGETRLYRSQNLEFSDIEYVKSAETSFDEVGFEVKSGERREMSIDYIVTVNGVHEDTSSDARIIS